MVWVLWGLVVLAVTLVALILLPPANKKGAVGREGFEGSIGFSINRLEQRVSALEDESGKLSHICSSIKEDISSLRKKDLASIAKLLEEGVIPRQKEVSLRRDDLSLREHEKTIRLLKQRIEELSRQSAKLSLEIKSLREEGAKKDRLIAELKDREVRLIRLLETVKLRLKKVSSELAAVKTSELKLRSDLFKQKTIYSDSEKEIERLSRENEELKDALSYELNN